MKSRNYYLDKILENLTGETFTGIKNKNYYLKKIYEYYGGDVEDNRRTSIYYLDKILEILTGEEVDGIRTENYYYKKIYEYFGGDVESIRRTDNYYLRYIAEATEESEDPTPVPTTLTLTNTKDIISYSHTESTDLTATVLDQDDNPLGGAVVTFKNGSTELDTVITDENGVAIYDYVSAGAGDVTLTVECGSLTETYSIEDCNYYNTAEVSRDSMNGSTIYDDSLSQTLPSDCEISFDISASNVSNNSERRFFILPKSQFSTSTSQPSKALFEQIANSQVSGGYRDNGTYGMTGDTASATDNTYYHIAFIRHDTSVEVYVDGTKLHYTTISFLDDYTDWTVSQTRWNVGGTSKIKNVKFKKL